MSTRLPDRGGSAQAVAAAVAVARAHGVRCADPVVLADRYNVRVHLRPAPVVARVATTTALVRPDPLASLQRELAVAGFLAGRGAPVVPSSDELPPGPYRYDGLAVSFWRFVACGPDRTPRPDQAGRLLAELHTALRDYPGALPYLAPW
ncbi:hypothetical protein TR74_09945, partial [Carbonactinospora thermoautotrophica]